MSSLGTLRPRGRRRAVLVAAGIGAAGVLAAIVPPTYDAIRREVLIRRLEEGDDPGARRELAEPRHAARLQARLEESGNARLAGPLIDLAAQRRLDPAIRAAVFGRFSRPELTDGAGMRTIDVTTGAKAIFPEGLTVSVAMARSGSVHTVDLGEWTGRSYTVPRESSSGDVVQFMEWFIAGEDHNARLVYQRSTWVIVPPDEAGGPLRVETEDLTDSSDPLAFFLGRPISTRTLDGVPGTFLPVGFFGLWRQFMPGPNRRTSSSYSIHLDVPGRTEGPVLLGWFQAHAGGWDRRGSLSRWRSALDQGPEGTMGMIVGFVPDSAARLEPFQKLKLLFRPAPEFAAENGISAPETDSPPFERELYLPPPER